VKKRAVAGIAVFLSLFLLGPVAWAADKPPVKVGIVQPLTGQGANIAKSYLEGANLAMEMINKEGGILGGRKIEAIVEDDQCIPAQSIAATKKLIHEDKLKVILAAMCSSATIADIPITKEAGVIQIVSSSVADSITEMGDPLLFRTCPTNKIMAEGMAYKIAQEYKAKSIAFYSVNDDYGRGLVEQTKKIFEKLGTPNVLFAGFFEFTERDFSAPITKMKGLKPEALYLISRFPQNAQILNQMAELGFKPRLFGPANLVAKDCIQAAGKNMEGMYAIVTWTSDLSNPANKKFVDAFQKKYGKLPDDDFAEWGYTGLMVTAMGIDKAGTDQDPKKIEEALRKLKWEAPGGFLAFDEKGQRTITLYIVQVRGGKPVLIQ
jgi:branched-chain amino acid transport system substrate-binding protein